MQQNRQLHVYNVVQNMYTNVGFEKIFSDVNLLKTLILLVRTTLLNRLYVAKYVFYISKWLIFNNKQN